MIPSQETQETIPMPREQASITPTILLALGIVSGVACWFVMERTQLLGALPSQARQMAEFMMWSGARHP